MPIEHEFKFILDYKSSLKDELDALKTSNQLTGQIDIFQAYLGKGARVRSKTWNHGSDEVEYIFTYKKDLSNHSGCLEIETEITKNDFDIACEEVYEKITKTRYIVKHNELLWEIDFFKDDKGIYFAMAEVEVSETSTRPNDIPDILKKHLLYIVDEDDTRFQNRKLSTRKITKKLLKEIKNDTSKFKKIP